MLLNIFNCVFPSTNTVVPRANSVANSSVAINRVNSSIPRSRRAIFNQLKDNRVKKKNRVRKNDLSFQKMTFNRFSKS